MLNSEQNVVHAVSKTMGAVEKSKLCMSHLIASQTKPFTEGKKL